MTKKLNYNSLLYVCFGIFLSIFAVLTGLRIFYATNFLMDTLEHIHASWLVGIGKIPYRDFFEHHNPLLWYLFAPFTWLFNRDANIIYIARFIAVGGYFLTLYFLYKVSKSYSRSQVGACLSVLFILCITSLWLDVQNLRPDIFMYVFILASIYYVFKYLDTHKVKYLCYSYLLWFIAFLFMQKTIIYGIGFLVATIWLLYKKKVELSHFFIALILPSILLLISLYYLYYSNLFKDWYECNFTFNFIIKSHYGNHSTGFLNNFFYQLFFTMLSVPLFFHSSDKGNILFSMWLFSGLFTLQFAPHPQYYFMLFVLAAILLTHIFNKLYSKYSLSMLVVFTIFLTQSFHTLFPVFSQKVKQVVTISQYVTQHTEPTDKLLNGFSSLNLFNLDADYYWFGFHNTIILADLYTDKHFDYNEQIRTHKPKFLFLSGNNFDRITFSNARWIRQRNWALIRRAANGDKSALDKLSDIKIDYWPLDMGYINENYYLVRKYGSTELWQKIDN